MKIDAVGALSAGMAGVATTWLIHFGTSWPALFAAIAGAGLAILEMEEVKIRIMAVVLIFNGVIGTLGGPILATFIQAKLEFQHPALLALTAFIVAFWAHDFLGEAKRFMISRMSKHGQ